MLNLSNFLKVQIVEKQFNLTPLFEPSISITTTRDNFHLLCRDGSISSRSPEIDSKFSCRYQHHSDPYLRLAPFKVEEINETPFIVVFHDIISETVKYRYVLKTFIVNKWTRNLETILPDIIVRKNSI